MIIAASIAKHCGEHMPPRWPQPLGIPWGAVMETMKDPDSHTHAAATFGEFRFAVTQAEAEAAASLATLLRAWRDVLDLGGDELEPVGRRFRRHLQSGWGFRMARPPRLADCDRIASRMTRRLDLLPVDARSW